MTQPMYAILDCNAGLYQWGGAASDPADALERFNRQCNAFDPDDRRGLYEVIEVSADEFEAVEKWWAAGAQSRDYPLPTTRPSVRL